MLKAMCVALHLCTTVTGYGFVTDGDTIRVEGIRIRLAGLDAEELKEPNGKRAKRALEILIDDRIVTCKLTGERSYDRYIGVCTVAGLDIGLAMVEWGMALDCARYSGGRYRSYEPVNIRQTLLQKPYC